MESLTAEQREHIKTLDLDTLLPIRRIELSERESGGGYFVSAIEPIEGIVLCYRSICEYIDNCNRILRE